MSTIDIRVLKRMDGWNVRFYSISSTQV